MGSEPIKEDVYKMKYLQICSQRQRELEKCSIALLKARDSLQPSDALDIVNDALCSVFDL